jgi:putative ABC transport system permease protein
MTFLLHLRRNMKRNPGRSLAVILVVALAIGIFLVLGQVSTSIVAYSDQVVASVPNILLVQTAGGSVAGGEYLFTNGGASGATLSASLVSSISATQYVESVQRAVIGNGEGSGTAPGNSACQYGNSVIGEDTTSSIKLFGPGIVSGAATPIITSGRNLASSDENTSNIIIGQQYSSDNHLYAGDQMTMEDHTFNIVGVFEGSSCEGDIVVMPYAIEVTTFGASDPSLLYVNVDSYNNVFTVYNHLQTTLGSSYSVEDLSTADHNSLQNAISAILLSSQFGEYAALIAGASVMIIVMVLVTSRRTKEIGLLKALGYGNSRVLGLVLLEALILSAVGLPLALGFIFVFGPVVAQSMLSHIGSSGAAPPPGANLTVSSQSNTNPFLQNLHFALTPETVIIASLITIAFGVMGAFYPLVKAIRLRPIEALRQE